MKHTTLYVYDESLYKRMSAVAKLQGKSLVRFMWDELVSRMNQNYNKGTLAQFINEGEIVKAPSIDEGMEQQKMKFMQMSLNSLEEYHKDLMRHIKIFKNELRSKKNE